jgi:hypothetical protein
MLKQFYLILERKSKMSKLLIILIICVFSFINSIECQKNGINSLAKPKQSHHKLRKFSIFDVDDKQPLNAHELLENIQGKLTKQVLDIKNKDVLLEEAKRRRIYVQYLLPSQGRSNVLRDIFTNRY